MSDGPAIHLRYFPFPARAGAIRDALRIGRIPFKDEHVPLERFAELKAGDALPFGSLPVIAVIVAGKTVTSAQSNAILRYIGRLTGLYPVDDPLSALKVDEALDVAEDLYHVIGPSMGEPDPDRRMAMRKVIAEETLPRWGGYLEKLLVANERTGFVVGDTVTVADLKLHWIVDKLTNGTLDDVPMTVLDGFETLTAWRKNVAAVREARLAEADLR